MADQFAIYQALHAETCKVAGANCAFATDGWSISVWAGYLLWIATAFALLLFVRSGLAQKMASFAERRTDRLWLQTLIVVGPLVLAYTTFDILRNIWGYSQNPTIGNFDTPCPKLIHLPDELPECVEGLALWWAFLSEYLLTSIALIVVAAFCTYILLRVFRYAPKRFWLLPVLGASALFIYHSAGFDRDSRTRPLGPDNSLIAAVKPLAIREGWPLDRIHVSDGNFSDRRLQGRVVGLGSQKRITFGEYIAFTEAELPVHLQGWSKEGKNGFRHYRPSPAMLRSIMGHELAHVQRWHSELRLLWNISFALLLSWMIFRVLSSTKMWSTGWTAIPIYLAALCAAVPLHDAIGGAVALATEYDADWVGLEISQEPDGFAAFALLSAAGSPLELSPLDRWRTYHPSFGERIRISLKWQHANRPNRPLAVPDTKAFLIPAKEEQKPR